MIRKPLILFTGTCSDTNVGIRDELKVIPNDQMFARTERSNFPAKFGRLQGTKAWCPLSNDTDPYLQIDLGQKYVICGVEAQGKPGASMTTGFTLDYAVDDGMAFTDLMQVMPCSQICHLSPFVSGCICPS